VPLLVLLLGCQSTFKHFIEAFPYGHGGEGCQARKLLKQLGLMVVEKADLASPKSSTGATSTAVGL